MNDIYSIAFEYKEAAVEFDKTMSMLTIIETANETERYDIAAKLLGMESMVDNVKNFAKDMVRRFGTIVDSIFHKLLDLLKRFIAFLHKLVGKGFDIKSVVQRIIDDKIKYTEDDLRHSALPGLLEVTNSSKLNYDVISDITMVYNTVYNLIDPNKVKETLTKAIDETMTMVESALKNGEDLTGTLLPAYTRFEGFLNTFPKAKMDKLKTKYGTFTDIRYVSLTVHSPSLSVGKISVEDEEVYTVVTNNTIIKDGKQVLKLLDNLTYEDLERINGALSSLDYDKILDVYNQWYRTLQDVYITLKKAGDATESMVKQYSNTANDNTVHYATIVMQKYLVNIFTLVIRGIMNMGDEIYRGKLGPYIYFMYNK